MYTISFNALDPQAACLTQIVKNKNELITPIWLHTDLAT